MKKIVLLICAVILVFGLAACASNSADMYEVNNDTVYFTGVITQINDNTALVTPNEGEQIASSGDAVYISLESNTTESFAVGDTIRVGYDGSVMESYPLQVNEISVEKVQ